MARSRPRSGVRALVVPVVFAAGLLIVACTGQTDETTSSTATEKTAEPTGDAVTPSVAVTTPVPAPGSGTVDDVVEDGTPGPTQDAAIGDEATLPDNVVVEITDVEKLEVEAQTPGEIAGPAVAVTLEVTNGTDADIDFTGTIVTTYSGSGAYGQPTTSEPSAPLSGVVAPGDSAEGVYVFLLPEDDRDGLEITVEYGAGAPIVVFTE